MAEPSLRSSRHRSQPSVSRTNTSIRSGASSQHGHSASRPGLPQPIPIPSPVSQLNPSGEYQQRTRSYYLTNPDPTPSPEDDNFVDIAVADADGHASGFENQPNAGMAVPRRKQGGKTFIGGFVRSLRKIPRSMKFRPGAQHAQVTNRPTQPTRAGLPNYMFTPPTPVAPQQQTSYISEHPIPFPQPEAEAPDIHPATSPHPTRISLDNTTVHSPEHNPDRDPDAPSASRRTSQRNNNTSVTHHNSFAYPNSYRDPPSIAAHPQPTPDYRRMSRNTGEESTHPNPTIYSSGSPSFSSELDRTPFRMFRFMQPLLSMPWVSYERVTVDYSPGMDGSRGVLPGVPGARKGRASKDRQSKRWSLIDTGWKPWRRTSVFLTMDGRIMSPEADPDALARAVERGDARKGKMFVPVNKPLTSWYSGGHAGKKSPRYRRSDSPRELDLMSSGSEPRPRSSVITTTPRTRVRRRSSRSVLTSPSSLTSSSPAPRPRNRNSHRQDHRRQSQRLYYSSDEYAFLEPGSTPASSPILARRSNIKPRPRESHRDRSAAHIRRHNRDMKRPPQPLVPPVPSAPGSPYPISPLVFLSPNHLDSTASQAASPGPANEPYGYTQTGVPMVGVAPVYMSILPGMPPLSPGSNASAVGESSPPGLAGRGAGGGYESGYRMPGGSYTYGYAYPYPSQSPPPSARRHDDKPPLQPTG